VGLGHEEPSVDADSPEGGTVVDPGGADRRPEDQSELRRPQRASRRRPPQLLHDDPVGMEAEMRGLVPQHDLAHRSKDGVAGAAQQPVVGGPDDLGHH
jgi:hypothetical protein